MSSSRATTVPDLLRNRADEPRAPAYHFYAEGACDATAISYGELHDEVGRITASLLRYDAGERVIVAMPSGPGFLRAFFASLYAGLVPVPIPVLRSDAPSGWRKRSLDIIRDANPVAVFLSADQHPRERANLGGMELFDSDRLEDFSRSGDERSVAPEAPALLQYSSGTGGRPKGVLLSHRAIISNLETIREAFGHSAESRGLIWLPPFHDMGLIGGLLQPLYAGFPVCVMRPEIFARQPLRWLQAISSFRATTSGGPCAAYEACIRSYRRGKHNDVVRALDLSTWSVPFVGAEPIHADTLKRFAELFRSHGFRPDRFLPCYGLAEHTLIVTAHPRGTALACDTTERGRSFVSCGWTAPPAELLIVDPETRAELPDGVRGEVWVVGPSVGIGYWNQSEATARTFGARCASRPGTRFLRTGDLGFVKRRRLFITGRLKNLVIVNGQNYESEVLEQAILESSDDDSVLSCLAFATDDARSQIVVLVEVDHRKPRAALAAIEPRIRRVLAEELELSIGTVELLKRGALLRTSSGKLHRRENESKYQRGALVPLDIARSIAPVESAEEGLEVALVDVIARELAVDRRLCREAESLATLGMDSLKAMSLQEQIAADLGVEVSLLDLLAGGSVAELAKKARPVDSARGRGADYELTRTQRSIWFAHQLDPGVGAFNLGCTVRVDHELLVETLNQAAHDVLAVHPELRARYRTRDGSLIKELVDDLAVRVERLENGAGAFLGRPFDLEVPPLLRVGVSQLDAGFRLHVIVHHIAADYASVAIVVEQLCETYRALTAGEQPPDLRPSNRSLVAAPSAAVSTESTPPIALTRLLTDRPRGSWRWNVAKRRRVIDEALMHNVEHTAAALGVTPHAMMLATLMAILHRYTGEEMITVGSPVSSRTVGLQCDVGCFISLVPMSLRVDGGSTLADLANRITGQIARAIDHERGASYLAGDSPASIPTTGQPPVCNVVFAHYPEISSSRGPDASWQVEAEHDNAAVFELLFSVGKVEGRTSLNLTYAADLFERETVDGLMDHFLALMAAVSRRPRTPLRELALEGSAPSTVTAEASAEPFSPVGERLARQVKRTPDRVAVVCGREQVSYGALHRQSIRLALRLQKLGIGRETAVGIHLSRDPRLVAALLAVLGLGATYVALDPSLPRHRLQWMVANAGAGFVLTETSQREVFEGGAARLVFVDEEPGPSNERLRRHDIHPEQLAYILYTSGSTGMPKGVAIRHAGVSNLVSWASSFFSAEQAEGVLASTSLGFDLSVFEILAPLCHGGTVILAETIADLALLAARQAVTVVNTVPSALGAVLPSLPRSVHTVNLAGEPFGLSLVRDLFQRRHVTRVFNLYGPSEDTTYSTACRLREHDEVISIGSPLPGTTALVGDELAAPVAAGIPGELYLSGGGLARGYVQAPGATANSFVPHPHARTPGERLYRTGDRVRMSASGDLRFHGRLDRQLKLRGFRIEPPEIEYVINQVEGVVTSAVIVDDRVPERRALAAFVVPSRDETTERDLLDEVRARTLERLPHYMVPHRLVAVEKLPVTTNGKLDRRRLLEEMGADGPTVPAAPRSVLEREILLSWQRSLSTSSIGIHDNLFLQGADSLLFLQFVAEVRDLYGVELSVKDAFRCPSVASVSELIEDRRPNREAQLDALLEHVESLSDEEAQRVLDAVENGET